MSASHRLFVLLSVSALIDSFLLQGLHADKYRVAMILKKLSPEDVAARMKLPKSPGAAPTPKKKVRTLAR